MKFRRIFTKTLVTVLTLSIFLGGNIQVSSKESSRDIIRVDSGFENLNQSLEDDERLYLQKGEPSTLDINKGYDSATRFILNNVSEGLFSYDHNRRIVAGVADSYSLSEDQLSYTFYLRKDAKWNDGSPVTAHDFVYSWQRLCDFEDQAKALLTAANIKNYKNVLEGKSPKEDLGIKAIDDYTLVVELENPVPYFLSLLTQHNFAPIKKDMVIASGDKYGTDLEYIAYNGPYIISDWDKGNYLLLTKNPYYWGSEFIDVENINVLVYIKYGYDAFLYNIIDTTKLYYDDYVKAYMYGLTPISTKNDAMFYLKFNQNDTLLQNENARRAIALGFDNSYITELTQTGHAANYYVPSGFFKDEDGVDFRQNNNEFLQYNEDLALKFWDQAKSELGIQTYTMELLTFNTYLSQFIAIYIKEELEDNLPGLTVNIVQQPSDIKQELENTGQYTCSFAGWGMDYNDPLSYLEIFSSNSPYNDVDYNSPLYDTIIQLAQSSSALDEDEKWELLKAAETLLLQEDVVIKPIYQQGNYYLVMDHIKNLIQDYGMNDSLKFVIIE
ncbi:peptide ABC transporter substrate-binding protein [Vallitalea okinawensis]|uniref:peptide ABC transporter substrate-binding protein n=1 Tax=Vallitalea okinawensis TaxID=2078660 RepID=UPI000CFCD35C|nr:peptide ABC transporter substrate-binding protein [Vallitalea okinawensis]